jgi:hypothetical protein
MRWTGDHAMKSISTKSDSSQPAADTAVYLFDDWFDPIRRIKTQTVLPSADTAAMLFWALLAHTTRRSTD